MQDEDRVVALRIEGSPGLIRDRHIRYRSAKIEVEVTNFDEPSESGVVPVPPERTVARWRQGAVHAFAAAKPVSRSARMSLMFSRPTASRINPGVTPAVTCSSSVNCEWVVDDG